MKPEDQKRIEWIADGPHRVSHHTISDAIRELLADTDNWKRAAYEALGVAWQYGTSWGPNWYDEDEDLRLGNASGYARQPEKR